MNDSIGIEGADGWDDEPTERWKLPIGARIVVAEDHRSMREMVAARLRADGYRVHDDVSGDDLLRTLETIRRESWPLDGVDLVVLDQRMPGIAGLEAVRRLRIASWDVPVILMTAFPEPSVLAGAAALRTAVLPKPFSLDLLTNTVLLTLLSRIDAPSRV